MAVQRAARYTGNFLVVDDGLAILPNRDHAPNERDVIRLPYARFSRQLGRRGEKAVDAAHMMTRRSLNGSGLDLNSLAAGQLNAVLGVFSALDLAVQLELFDFRVVVHIGPFAR